MNGSLTEVLKIVTGLDPSSDMYDGDPSTDIINMEGFNKAYFVVHESTAGSSNKGKATFTIEACDNAAGSNVVAIPFKYRKKTTGASEAWGSLTAATASGFSSTAGEDTIYVIEVCDADLPAGYPFVRLVATEGYDDPVIGSVIVLLEGARYKDPDMSTALS